MDAHLISRLTQPSYLAVQHGLKWKWLRGPDQTPVPQMSVWPAGRQGPPPIAPPHRHGQSEVLIGGAGLQVSMLTLTSNPPQEGKVACSLRLQSWSHPVLTGSDWLNWSGAQVQDVQSGPGSRTRMLRLFRLVVDPGPGWLDWSWAQVQDV